MEKMEMRSILVVVGALVLSITVNCLKKINYGSDNLQAGGKSPIVKEICDEIDNNKNGVVDESCIKECIPGHSDFCGLHVGECQQGVMICGDNWAWGECLGGIFPQPEIEDGKDNDCNGEVDNTLHQITIDAGGNCVPGTQIVCSNNFGACREGRKECLFNGKYGPCVGAIFGKPEVCDEIDNDCDGIVDNNCEKQ